eukprot:EG_transcript_12614
MPPQASLGGSARDYGDAACHSGRRRSSVSPPRSALHGVFNSGYSQRLPFDYRTPSPLSHGYDECFLGNKGSPLPHEGHTLLDGFQSEETFVDESEDRIVCISQLDLLQAVAVGVVTKMQAAQLWHLLCVLHPPCTCCSSDAGEATGAFHEQPFAASGSGSSTREFVPSPVEQRASITPSRSTAYDILPVGYSPVTAKTVSPRPGRSSPEHPSPPAAPAFSPRSGVLNYDDIPVGPVGPYKPRASYPNRQPTSQRSPSAGTHVTQSAGSPLSSEALLQATPNRPTGPVEALNDPLPDNIIPDGKGNLAAALFSDLPEESSASNAEKEDDTIVPPAPAHDGGNTLQEPDPTLQLHPPVQPPQTDPRKACPHCKRRFNPEVADRHIP